MTTFREGQKVRVKPINQTSIEPYDGTVMIIDKVITVDGDQKSVFVLWGTKSYNFNVATLEVVKERVEGREIDPELIRKGDKIKAVQTLDDVTVYREGTVETTDWDSWAGEYTLRSKEHVRISFNNSIDSFYILLKSGPEPDPVREKLEELDIDQVFEYGYPSSKIVARKTGEDRFLVYGTYGTKVYTLAAMRSLVGTTEIRALSAV